MGGAIRTGRPRGADRIADLQRAAATLPAGGAGTWPCTTARAPSRPHRRPLRAAADLVSAVRGDCGRSRRVPTACRDAAAHGDVPLLGIPERVAAADPWAQPSLHQPPDGEATRTGRR